MEDKQLNFSKPLLSVRRFSSTVSTGKDEKRKTDRSTKPKVPLIPFYKSDLKSGPISNAGTVPFVWEQIPGRPKDENTPQFHVMERPPVAPKLPPGRILKITKQDSDKHSEPPSRSKRHEEVLRGSQNVSASYKNVTELKSSKDTRELQSSESGEGDEAYLDALDTLSRTESSFMNCSESGISGLDGLGVNTSGTFLTDPQTRDFMMGRFLPAAKAMSSETPQYTPKKQHVVQEQPRQMMKIMNGDKQPPLRYGPNISPHYAQEKDEEESDDDYEQQSQFPAKVCGLLPRFCLKSSLCLLNPVPGLSVRTRVPMSPASRTYRSSSSTGSSGENENEMLDQISCPFNPQKLEGSSLYRRLQGSGMASHHNELHRSASPEQNRFITIPGESKNAAVTGFSSLRKDGSTVQEPLADPSRQEEAHTRSPVIEKTLYVDIVHKVESPSKKSYASDLKEERDMETLIKYSGMEETHLFKDIESLNMLGEEANLEVISQKIFYHSLPSLADKSNQISAKNTLKGFGQHEDLEAQQPSKAENFKKSNGGHLELPVPPPLPKSPSDSWLWRTLPTKSSRTPSSRLNHVIPVHPGNQASKTSSTHVDWGTVVKTNKDILKPIPEI